MASVLGGSGNRTYTWYLAEAAADTFSAHLGVSSLLFEVAISMKLLYMLLNISGVTDTQSLNARTAYYIRKLLIALGFKLIEVGVIRIQWTYFT